MGLSQFSVPTLDLLEMLFGPLALLDRKGALLEDYVLSETEVRRKEAVVVGYFGGRVLASIDQKLIVEKY